ncbi:MAG: 6-bladed beta-propeller, partial [Candidatus Odinarchaeota archaeon]
MKHRTKTISIALFLSVFMMLVSFGGQEAEWRVKIEIEDGVKVIKNPGEPLYGEITFELEENLSIGNEDNENYMFFNLSRIAFDSEQNIFVLDAGNCRIQKFDKNGNFLQTIGRRGQGPGEFEQPRSIQFDLKNRIYVYDSLRRNLYVFEKDGKFKKTIRLAN